MATGYDADLALYIDGTWRSGEGRDTLDVVDPASGETIGAVPLANEADLDEALAAADRAFPAWRDMDVEKRGAILKKAAALLMERSDDIARLLTLEQGKPLAQAKGEVAGSAQLLEWAAEEAKRLYGRVLVRPPGQRSIVIRQPIGPVAAFSPWNFPLYLMAKKLAPALACGCVVISKPPEETPGCTGALMRALHDAGVPAGVAQLVHGVPDMVSRHLLASPVIRKLSFTGSVPVGKHLMKLAADGLKRVTMELGGHAPVLVFDDVDLDRVLDMAVPQKYRNAGQVCVSPTRFFVQDSLHDRFVEGFAARAKAVKVGHGLEEGVQMGPLANVRRPDAIGDLVGDAVAQGATLAEGGVRGNAGFFFQPTLLANVPDSAKVMNSEPFGPIAVTQGFATLEEAIAKANRLPYGLAAFAFTNDLHRAGALGEGIESGMVGINTFAISAVDSPFGGVKESGFGSEGGPEGFDAYLVTKAIHQA
ncbi:MAG: NAD-dependent succinate-semialdehyde dehydrogenase [Sphingomonadales bacterium]|nr:NAD-dependent succinate-semialdehyde dehydrogenase [Sphingomonadales bacterium]MBD3773996.1 NAD-dependent succinate-semialdehyde dehydrogenase [Paracoccaceae bacterium]